MSNSISIVVDADIARASGTTEHPVSSGARNVLDLMSSHGHVLAMCPTLSAEWKKHRSQYSVKWYASMIAKKKVIFLNPAKVMNAVISSHIEDDKKVDIATKDSHLVDTALSAGKIIASNDDNSRRIYCEIAQGYGQIRDVKWFHSVRDKDFLQNFLSQNCYVPQQYYLVGSS